MTRGQVSTKNFEVVGSSFARSRLVNRVPMEYVDPEGWADDEYNDDYYIYEDDY